MNRIEIIDSNEERVKLEDLYKKYRGLMFHIAIKIVKDKTLAEDVLSDSVIKLIRHRKKIFEMNCYQQQLYIVNIIKTTSWDMLKKMKYNTADDTEDILSAIPDNDDVMLDQLIAKEGYETIKEAIKALPDSLRNVAYLNLICERNHEEIAEILGISNAASKMRLTRAKKAMREALTGGENGK
ncbi:MAG: sigma-70 family RNA polymerase sigma factor [Defluviitaleaceae bacterium]|nr:sigma-70 family RNA polymerase sigma factor [Defluviitaleaceae bacterium]MCL2262924.1 sigma-70 family RNA polymerase sigma factor [Defluviitaleaceae bacterium]